MRFMAIANVSCASVAIDPNDMAPVQKRLVIDSIDSTSSMEIAVVVLNLNRPRSVHRFFD